MPLSWILLGVLISCIHTIGTAGAHSIGVCYGTSGNNLPDARKSIELIKSKGITRIRIYEPNQETLQALRGSKLQVIVGILNHNLQSLTNASAATTWVQTNILAYSDVKFRYISIGNEVNPADPIAQYVLPAMQNIFKAIENAGLQTEIKVSTVTSASLLGASYPPSVGAFSRISNSFIGPIISFLVRNNSPLLANVYPYFSYISNIDQISLFNALFTGSGIILIDGNLEYLNIFDMMVDSIYAALEKMNGSNAEIVVSESGWPSAGEDGNASNVENAETYYRNMINHVQNGTPRRPGRAIETYLYALYDENQKGPSEIGKHFGIFSPNQQPKYQLIFPIEKEQNANYYCSLGCNSSLNKGTLFSSCVAPM